MSWPRGKKTHESVLNDANALQCNLNYSSEQEQIVQSPSASCKPHLSNDHCAACAWARYDDMVRGPCFDDMSVLLRGCGAEAVGA